MKKAFTLIELLVVIAIIGILSVVVLSSVESARESARIASILRFSTDARNTLDRKLIESDYSDASYRFSFDEDDGTWYSHTIAGESIDYSSLTGVERTEDTPSGTGGALYTIDTAVRTAPNVNQPYDSITYMNWFKFESFPTSGVRLVSSGVYNRTRSYIYTDGRIAIYIANEGHVVPTGVLRANRWHHLLTSYADGVVKFYLDGNLLEERSATIDPSLLAPQVPSWGNNIWQGYGAGGAVYQDDIYMYPVGFN